MLSLLDFVQEVAARLLEHGELLGRAKPPPGKAATTLALAPRCLALRRLSSFHKAQRRTDGASDVFGGL